MTLATRWMQRILIFLIAAATLWFIVTQLFDRLDQRLPTFLALLATYGIAAYGILPPVIHASAAALRRNRIPRVTRAGDGLPADPVNLVLLGSMEALRSAFAAAGWHEADRLGMRSALRMAWSFVADRPYPGAPFSALYLFGRRQDIGFQLAVGNSPRRRHHVRFWAAHAEPETETGNLAFWTKRQPTDLAASRIWVGAATTDTGFGLQGMTLQISHRVDPHADPERDHVMGCLSAVGRVGPTDYIEPGAPVGTRFVTDGRIARAALRE